MKGVSVGAHQQHAPTQPVNYSRYERSCPINTRTPVTTVASAIPNKIPRAPALTGTASSQSRTLVISPKPGSGSAPTSKINSTNVNKMLPQVTRRCIMRYAPYTSANNTKPASDDSIDTCTVSSKMV